jgi:hypothetical protein
VRIHFIITKDALKGVAEGTLHSYLALLILDIVTLEAVNAKAV